MELFLISLGAMFSIMNPLSTVPVFVSLTADHELKEKNRVAVWTSINVLIILLLSFFVGQYILQFFGISINALKIAGGLIITSSGFALLTGKFKEHKGMTSSKVDKDIRSRSDIALTPLAIPMLAGPGTISLLITLNQEHKAMFDVLILMGAMFVACTFIFLLLKSAQYIVNLLGASGINALSRIIGFIVIAIGIEYIISAVSNLFPAWVG
ncbi:MarC family NAAT transporter [Lishizhenia sp.]|uniref:MarC family NAAT transporter n=1 Tax=Lishizhenia sp. TaxID=2497594 RepID=UPI00299E64AD|nr:MarC family NAAT transporter [Lishizhenia sp.]MDX1445432.1 MarC family NAAT transporter [Lishizhenia sp.]